MDFTHLIKMRKILIVLNALRFSIATGVRNLFTFNRDVRERVNSKQFDKFYASFDPGPAEAFQSGAAEHRRREKF